MVANPRPWFAASQNLITDRPQNRTERSYHQNVLHVPYHNAAQRALTEIANVNGTITTTNY
jgi:predicted N-formylglutamate amidohydrolase